MHELRTMQDRLVGSTFVVLLAAALVLVFAGPAQATVTITLTGPGSGTVTSNTGSPTINCSLSGGVTSGTCSNTPPADFFTQTTITATAAPDSVFAGWTLGGGGCATGTPTTPCVLNTSEGANYSLTASFIPPPPPPTAVTDPADGVIDTHGVMHGRVNPEGTPLTSCRFEYGTSDDYGATMPCDPNVATLGSGTSEKAVSAITEKVEPGVTYHYRLVATNIGGAAVGEDRTFTTAGTPLCANSDVRVTQGITAVLLPDCMGLEMASPSMKFNQEANRPVGISATGERVAFNSTAALAETPTHPNAFGTTYVSTRELPSPNWETASAAPPDPLIIGGSFPIAKSFIPDFSRWIHVPLTTSDRQALGIGQVFVGGLNGLYAALSPPLVPTSLPPEVQPVQLAGGTRFQAASADHSHIYFRARQLGLSFLVGDPIPAGSGADINAYVAQLDPSGNPSLELVARDSDNKVWGGNCGARIGGIDGPNGLRNQGAVSADGTRLYFSTRPTQPATGSCSTANNKLRIMQRVETASGPWIKEQIVSECGAVPRACPGTGTGNISSGSKLVTNFVATSASGTFAVEMGITGTGIPANTKIAQVLSPTELELSAPASQTLSGVALRANDGDDFYQGASVDGTKVYFTSTRQLVGSDLDGTTLTSPATSCTETFATATTCDLYLYDYAKPAGERLTQVSKGDATNPTPGAGANVLNGISAISGDGSRVYFVAKGVLTTGVGPEGNSATTGQANLYTWEAGTGETAFIGTLTSSDAGFVWGNLQGTFLNRAYPVPVTGTNGKGEEVGGDGHVLLFQSRAALTNDDGEASFRDVFRYDAEATPPTLVRVSKAMPEGSDDGAFNAETVPVQQAPGTDFAEASRWVSEDGRTVVFLTEEGLVPSDDDGFRDTYLWKAGSAGNGELVRLPRSTDLSQWLSHDGSMAVFEAPGQEIAQDGDSVNDVYVAVSGGGTPPEPPPAICNPSAGQPSGGECQSSPPPPPSIPSASSTTVGTGNVKGDVPEKPRCPKGKRLVRRKGKARCVKPRANRKSKARRHSRSGLEQGGQK